MVEVIVLGLCAFLLGIAATLLFNLGVAEVPQVSASIREWFTPEATQPTVDVPTMRNTMPRVRPSWRKQRRDLQAAHNSKQKERDALFQEK